VVLDWLDKLEHELDAAASGQQHLRLEKSKMLKWATADNTPAAAAAAKKLARDARWVQKCPNQTHSLGWYTAPSAQCFGTGAALVCVAISKIKTAKDCRKMPKRESNLK